MYKVATLFSNCRTCMYGSQVSAYFDIAPPSFREYLVLLNKLVDVVLQALSETRVRVLKHEQSSMLSLVGRGPGRAC